MWIISLIGFLLTGVNQVFDSQNNDEVSVTHIHGMGYSTDGQRLMFAAHNGLKVYSNGDWSVGSGDNNDYMGFSVYDQGFYSSGHPSLDSILKNPFGVIRSLDEGSTYKPVVHDGIVYINYYEQIQRK